MGKIIWIASFPKSGNTWMRAFLANYVLNSKEPFPINDLRAFTLSDTRPRFFHQASGRAIETLSEMETVKLRMEVQELIADFKPHDHFVKTHSQNVEWKKIRLINPYVSKGALYLVRNPLDLVISYSSHLGVSLDEAIHLMSSSHNSTIQENYKVLTIIGRWDDHIKSWSTQKEIPCLLVRYEDLISNPTFYFSKVIDVLGLPYNKSRLERAIQFSSFLELSTQENKIGFIEKPPHSENFFRAGVSGSWREVLTKEQIKKVISNHGTTMEMLKYDTTL